MTFFSEVRQFLQGGPRTAAGSIRYQAVFMMGLPGAGKGHVKARTYLKHQGFVDIDPDDIKKEHPEFDPGAFGSPQQNKIHEWSFSEAASRLQAAMRAGDPFILDGTGTDPDKLIAKMRTAEAAGYRTFLAYVRVPAEIALFRNRNRGAKPGGRWVPEKVILGKVGRQDAAFGKARQQADKFKVFSNYDSNELALAQQDMRLYPPPQTVLPPRPGDPEYGMSKRAAAAEEYSFVMFKPLAVKMHRQEAFKKALGKLGVTFDECERRKVTRSLISKHYQEHSHKPFFPNLIDYYMGKVVEACRVSGPRGTILKIRRKLGPSDPTMCIPGEHLRAEAQPYAETGQTCGVDNFVHASDSPASAYRELKLWGLAPTHTRMAGPHLVKRTVIASGPSRAWEAWVGFTGDEPKAVMDRASEEVAKVFLRYLRQMAPKVRDFEVQQAPRPKSRTVWFLPDEACILPVYIRAGDDRMWTAKAGGGAGIPLGRDPIKAMQKLVRVCEAQNAQWKNGSDFPSANKVASRFLGL